MPVIKTCLICGKEFEAKTSTQKYCKGPHYYKCKICGKEFEYNGHPCSVPNTCSSECKKKYRVIKLQEKYGPDITSVSQLPEVRAKKKISNASAKSQEKMKQTCLKKYGVERANQSPEVRKKISDALKSEEVREKTKKTYQERYGVDHIFADKEFREKYGADNVGNRPEVKEKVKQTLNERYGVDSISQIPGVADKAKETRKNTMKKRYGADTLFSTEIFKEHIKETYGVDNVAQSSKIKEVKEKNSLDKYGVTYPSKLPEIRKKISDTVTSEEYKNERIKSSLEKYGTEWPTQSQEVKQKIKDTNMERYGHENTSQRPEFKEKLKHTNMERYGVACGFQVNPNYKTISKVNRKFSDFLTTNKINFTMEYFIDTRAYDFKLETSNILIEINPTITHNSYFSIFDKNSHGKDKDYHSNKTELATLGGYRCIHVWDWDDWDSILKLLPSNNIVDASECEIQKISVEEASLFEDDNYVFGRCKGQILCFGLYYNNELVEIMTFGKPKYTTTEHYEWEFIVNCFKSDIFVQNGFKELFNYFVKTNTPKSIIAYCDRSKFDGSTFENLGMKLHHTIPPKKIWSRKNERITDSSLLQKLNKQKLRDTSVDIHKRDDLMISNGWLPVYDCGQLVYTWKKDKK